MARSAFHHSLNYRSVMILGQASKVINVHEKNKSLEMFMEKIVPQRWQDIRPPSAKELKATTILKMPIDEASAKIRTGPPIDDKEDYNLNCWAGVVEIYKKIGQVIDDPKLSPSVKKPDYMKIYKSSEIFDTVLSNIAKKQNK